MERALHIAVLERTVGAVKARSAVEAEGAEMERAESAVEA